MKLTLRELFLLVVIAAMGCGWWVDHRSLSARGTEAEKRAAEKADETERAWKYVREITSEPYGK